MGESERVRGGTFLTELLREERRLIPRLAGVFRFDEAVYREIDDDPSAIPGAFAVVLATSILAALGQGSLPAILLGIVGALFVWVLSSGLLWGAAALVVDTPPDYARLLRCLGFPYAWNVVAIGAFLPGVGPLVEWAALGLWGYSLFLAIRTILGVSMNEALGICGAALLPPVLLLFWIFR